MIIGSRTEDLSDAMDDMGACVDWAEHADHTHNTTEHGPAMRVIAGMVGPCSWQ